MSGDFTGTTACGSESGDIRPSASVDATIYMSPEDWQDEIEERKLMDNTLMDGLEEEADEAW